MFVSDYNYLHFTHLKFGVSILSGALTLGAMTLPVIIGSCEEALRAVPDTYREASLGLGATKWQTIYRVVLPASLPGILTGAIFPGLIFLAGVEKRLGPYFLLFFNQLLLVNQDLREPLLGGSASLLVYQDTGLWLFTMVPGES